MTCPVCSNPTPARSLCAACEAKVQTVRPAGRFIIDRAAQKSLRLATRSDADMDTLIDYVVSGHTAGRNW